MRPLKYTKEEFTIFENYFKNPSSGFKFTPENIIKMVSQSSGVSVKHIKGPGRQKVLTCPRNVAIYYIRKLVTYPGLRGNKLPYMALEHYFNRDHSSLIKSVQVFKDMMFTKELAYVELVDKIELKISDKLAGVY